LDPQDSVEGNVGFRESALRVGYDGGG